MRNSFLRLRHHAVVGCNHQNHDVGRLSTAGAHCRKGFVPRSIEEGDDAARRLHVISTDVLRDAARFTRSDLGAADVVQQRRLTVVDVPHDRHDRRTRHGRVLLRTFFQFAQQRFGVIGLRRNRLVAHFFHKKHRGILIKHLVDRHHLPHLHQNLYDFGRLHSHLVRQIRYRNRFRHAHFANHGFGGHFVNRLLVMRMVLTAPAPGFFPVVTAAGLHLAAAIVAVVIPTIALTVALLTAAALLRAVVAFRRIIRVLSGFISRFLRGFLRFFGFLGVFFLFDRLFRLLGFFGLAVGLITAVDLRLQNGLGLTQHCADSRGFFHRLLAGRFTARLFGRLCFGFGLRRRRIHGRRRSGFHRGLHGRFYFLSTGTGFRRFFFSLRLTGRFLRRLFRRSLLRSFFGRALLRRFFRGFFLSGFFSRLLCGRFLSTLFGFRRFLFSLRLLSGFFGSLLREFLTGLRFSFGTSRRDQFRAFVFALHENALAAHFDFDRVGAALAVALTDGCRFTTLHRDLPRVLGTAFLTHRFQQKALIGFTHAVRFARFFNAGRLELGKKRLGGNTHFRR